MATVTLIDGREVDSSSKAWAEECLQRSRHVANMHQLTLAQRRDYLENVARREGPEAERRLRDRFAADWQARQDAKQAQIGAGA